MPKTSVILLHNIVGLGGESDLVKVAAGYARNYLYPQGLAVPVTSANKRRIEALRQRRSEREAHELNTMTELSKSISKLIAVIAIKTGDDGKMFGTVTAGMIADQLKTQFEIALDKKKIHLEHPIKTLGEYEVELRLHPEVKATLKLRVESTTPLAVPTSTPAGKPGEGKESAEGPVKTESRGHKRAKEEAAAASEAPAKEHRPERKPRAAKVEKPEKTEKRAKGAKAEETAKTE